MSLSDDYQLVQCYCKDGSQDAFGELVRRHIDPTATPDRLDGGMALR